MHSIFYSQGHVKRQYGDKTSVVQKCLTSFGQNDFTLNTQEKILNFYLILDRRKENKSAH